ncbi:hypothetical protein UFOVP998_36 [uncultured Caudovirales phage]|uniref:Uncharacterized protein n=1 Tax=uncultured Caudovirales phage TaxID=2100421 RepID=A0A6J5SFT8_9CAUD|nr:hypothetical protein UFOVP998_36 [uncultured Caudovirales phage]CAB4199148.1 hypothetical protein UFOVP1331_23 [uncultured Caudovirales phage]CAB4213066.1 hypothetical protein UFOVP1442_52 [uncultured Caudovirales phage]CAB5228102.1 hypothetical protein UFOVP1535_61 [uncultured Caudovirales phage]
MKHSWVKLRLHHYICRKCGCGKVNAQDDRRLWVTTYHLPTGESKALRHTPQCEWGPKSLAYLERYDSEIAAFVAARLAARAAKAAAPVQPDEAHP